MGSELPNGNQSVISISNNNYNLTQAKTQFIGLEMDSSLNYINHLNIPVEQAIKGQVISEISGIDYSAKTNTYFIGAYPIKGRSVVFEIKLGGLFDANRQPK